MQATSAATLALLEPAIFRGSSASAQQGLTPMTGVIYAIDSGGSLYFYQDLARNGTGNWANNGSGQQIGSGWNFSRVFSGGDGIIYAIDGNGTLYFYQDLARNGTGNWANGGTGQAIGSGWFFTHVFSGGDGTIYAIDGAGNLYFYRDIARNGASNWAYAGSGQQIASGWNYTHVFAGGNGVIYAIDGAGNLFFYQDVMRNGTSFWANWDSNGNLVAQPTAVGQQIGSGWNFSRVFSGGDGIIYAIDGGGNLYFYRDLARNGKANWANGGTGQLLGSGWNFTQVFGDMEEPIEGYCTPLSVGPGDQIQFHMTTGAPQFSVTYLRLKKQPGSDLDASIVLQQPFTVTGRIQPVTSNAVWETGCGWQTDFSATVPASGVVSGLYAAKCVDTNQRTFYVTFIVKPSQSNKKTLAVISNTNTWNAYNNWGGRSQYTLPTGANGVRLSFERPNPYANPNDGSSRVSTTDVPPFLNHLALAELWVLSWLENAGYGFDVYSDLDFHLHPDQFMSYKAIILNTHPEYWTLPMRDSIDQYLAQPNKKLVYLGGNGIFEKVSYDFANSQMVLREGNQGTGPAAEREPYYFRNLTTPRPERAVLGVAYEARDNSYAPYRVLQAQHRFFANTGLHNDDLIGRSGLNGPASGREYDFTSGTGPGQVANIQLLAQGTNGGGTDGANMAYYDTPSGGFVFSVGSLSFGGSLAVDAALQQIIKNVLNECV